MSNISRSKPTIAPDEHIAQKISTHTDAMPVVQKSNKSILSTIQHPSQVALLTIEELQLLADELREKIIMTTSQTGGHLAPSLGVVDLTLAMLSVFDPTTDKLIWDVGHQAYAYKLLTGRADDFHTLRQKGGISGFPHRQESPFDHFGVGHSSTSISAALGMAAARDMKGDDYHVVSVIGDGSLTAGIAFEGMNHAGANSRPFIVILNDNEMSIAKNVGALSLFMSRNLSSRWVRRVKTEVKHFLQSIPGIGDELYEIAKRSKHSFKNFFTPGILFEALNFNYIGAVDGHNIEELQKVLRLASTLDKPVLIHVLTQKGKGYEPAEQHPSRYHGVGSFDRQTGAFPPTSHKKSYSDIMGSTLCTLAKQHANVVAITAAMPDGTGLVPFAEQFPDRFYDVGICEQHAVTFAAGMATSGYKPFVCIYSTFMQRAYDQILHDVCIQNLPVTLCLDRAGLVGEDGATHQGVFDISYLRHIPNLIMCAPSNANELAQSLNTALEHDGPIAIRYPRGTAPASDSFDEKQQPLPIGKAQIIQTGSSGIALITLGQSVEAAKEGAKLFLEKTDATITLVNALWIKPLDTHTLKRIFMEHDKIVLLEEHALLGGFSSAVLEFALDEGILANKNIVRMGLPDSFIEHGAVPLLQKEYGLDAQGIATQLCALHK